MSNNTAKKRSLPSNEKESSAPSSLEEEKKEAALLASIGSTVASASTYESSVIQSKQYESIPTLLPTNEEDGSIAFGFPDLTGLIPSFSNNSNIQKKKVGRVGFAAGTKQPINSEIKEYIPHVQSVLQKTRNAIVSCEEEEESNEMNMLRIKEQILLSFLVNYAKLDPKNACIDVRREVLEERKRSAVLRNRTAEMKRKRKTKKIMIQQQQQQQPEDTTSSKSSALPVWETGGMSTSQRLEEIKKGAFTFYSSDEEENVNIMSTSKTASFGKQALQHQNSSRNAKRNTIMSMKKLMRIEDGVDIEGQVKEIEEKRRKREERREARRRRREQRGRKKKGAYEDEEETEFKDENNDSSNVDSKDSSTSREKHDNIKKESAPQQTNIDNITDEQAEKRMSEEEQTNKTVYCPNCQQDIPITNDYDADHFLSVHLNTCQNKRRTRHNTRPMRKRKVLNYNEDNDEDNMDENNKEQSENKTKKRRKRLVSPLSPAEKNTTENNDDMYIQDANEKDDDDADNVDDDIPLPTTPQTKAIDDMEEMSYEDRIEEWTQNGITKMKSMSDLRDTNEKLPGKTTYDGGLEIPAWINNKLFPYQRTSLRWMWELHCQKAGGIVGDEMGLGKTVQVCSFLGIMASNRVLNSALIVCPATVLSHWLSELATWAPGLRRILIHKMGEQQDGSALSANRVISHKLLSRLSKWLHKSRSDFLNEAIDEQDLQEYDEDIFVGTGYAIVTTYENIRKHMDVYMDHDWSYVVLDEGQKIRNPDADVTLACKRIRTPHRLLLSGTPIQNDLRELWSLFDFVFPGRLGTLPAFENEFADPIKRGGYANASPMQVQLAYRCALVLRDLINPYMLRRMKKDIKEVSRMPGKTEQVLFCRLSNRQRALYEAYLKSDEVRNILRGSTQLFRSITILRKICNHPDLVCGPNQSSFDSFVREGGHGNNENDSDSSSSEDLGDDDDNIDSEEHLVDRSGKFEVLAKILPLWKEQKHRVLIFCQWTKMLNIIQRFVTLQGWKFLRMDGTTNVGSRQRMVDDFNRDDTYFGMLMTTRTGGVGLNLTGADRIILYDPDWNPQTDAQARERAWRFGQKNAVTVYRLITAGTIEEKIYHRQIFKTAVTNQVLQDPRQRRLFSQRDLRDLFTLKADVGSVAKGGDGCTETAAITKGAGVIDPENVKEQDNPEDGQDDNENTLEEVLKSKGLAGVFDHDFVDNASSSKSKTVREMEEQAKVVAQKAAKALKESSSGQRAFVPTWTGSTENDSQRFGARKGSLIFAGSDSARYRRGSDASFSGAKSVGIAQSAGHGTSSSSLISQLKQRRQQIGDGGNYFASNKSAKNNEMNQYTELMKKIRDFIKRRGGGRPGCGPTTEELLTEFKKVSDHDAAIFKKLLNSLARIKKGRWQLK